MEASLLIPMTRPWLDCIRQHGRIDQLDYQPEAFREGARPAQPFQPFAAVPRLANAGFRAIASVPA
jgi:hypothetical protein